MVKKITHTQLGSLVKHLYSTKTPKGKIPMIIYGTFGVGKSTIIEDKAKEIAEKKQKIYIGWNEVTRENKDIIMLNPEKYFVLIDIRLSELDSSDVKGLPDFTKDKTAMEWKIPFFAKLLEKENSDGILFFDEINLACLKGNTKILTKDGYKKVKDVKKGDEVLDIKGIYSKVLATQKTLYQEDIYKIKATGIEQIETTFNHPFYVIEKYRKENIKHNVKQTISKPIWKMAEKLKKGDYVGIKVPDKTQLSNTLKDKDIDFARLCGMYVGNGWIEKNKNNTSYRLGLCYGTYKIKEREEVKKILQKVFPNTKLQISKKETAINYRITIQKNIYNYFKNQCGNTAKQKKIPFEILNSNNKNVMLNFLKGYIQADGCFMKDKKVKSKSKIGIATSSENLALGLQFMIARLGYLATINKDDKIRINYIKNRKITYKGGFTLRVTNTGFQELLKYKPLLRKRETAHYFRYNGFIWTKIREISNQIEGCNVYNFEVENNNTYTANNILTHNTPLVISSTYKIIHDRVVNESKINNNWLILCAGNKDEDRAYTHELASPLRDRACEVELLPPSIDDWTCYDEQTEILTNDGWKFFKNLKEKEKVWTLNLKKNEWELQKGIKRQYNVNTNLYSIKNNEVNLFVTNNHNILIKNDENNGNSIKKGFELVKAEKLPSRFFIPKNKGNYKGIKKDNFIIPKSFKIHNIPINKNGVFQYNKQEKINIAEKIFKLKDWLSFLGYFLSEGNVTKTNITISQKKGIVKDKIKNIITRLGYNFCQTGEYNLIITDKQLSDYLKQFGKSKDMFIPNEIKQLSKSYLDILFESLIEGDGTKYTKNYYRYCTISKKLANDVQEIALKCGWACDIFTEKTKKGNVYRVNIKRNTLTNLRKSRKHITQKKYNGKVYCVTTINGIIMVRRNGKTCWCGNSWATDKEIDSRIVGFLNWKPSNLHKVDFDDGQKFTTERGWERLHYAIQKLTDFKEIDLVSGTAIGEGIAREFTAFCKIKDSIKLDEIIRNPEKLKEVNDISVKYFVVTALAEHYKDKKVTFEKLLEISKVLDDMKCAEFIALMWKLSVKYAKERFRKDFTTKDLDNPLRVKFHEYLVK